jgi:DNA-binding transcriptional regulator YhcF (GntR family)
VILGIDPRSAVPPYEQIRTQITTMVRTGTLAEGSRLPPIRQLAKDLGLASGTVARAYKELEADGVVATRGRHGTVVTAPHAPAVPAPDRRRRVDEAAVVFAREAVHHGVDLDQAVAAVQRAFHSFAHPRSSAE